jgi:hypothetical protein
MTALDEEARAIQAGEFDDDDDEEEEDMIEGDDVQHTTETAPGTRDGSQYRRTQETERQRQPTPLVLRGANGVEIVDATEMDDTRSVRTTGGSTSRQITTATT